MRKLALAALVAAGCGALVPLPALAAEDGWIQVGEETVRYFLPGTTPPDGASLAGGEVATSLGTGAALATSEWLLIGTDHVRFFLPDTGTEGATRLSQVFVSSRTEALEYPLGGIQRNWGTPEYGAPWTETDTAQWRLLDRSQYAARYEIPVRQIKRTPWTDVKLIGLKTRVHDTYDITYRIDKPVRTRSGESIVDTRIFTRREETAGPWNYGQADPALCPTVDSGVEERTIDLAPKIYSSAQVAVDVKDLSASGQSRAASFTADASTGTQATRLTGSRKRVAFRADASVTSTSGRRDPTVSNGGNGGNGGHGGQPQPQLGVDDWAGSYVKGDTRVDVTMGENLLGQKVPIFTLLSWDKQAKAWTVDVQDGRASGMLERDQPWVFRDTLSLAFKGNALLSEKGKNVELDFAFTGTAFGNKTVRGSGLVKQTK